MANPDRYCPICGVYMAEGHRCDEKRLARIERGRKGWNDDRAERRRSYNQRIRDGFELLGGEDDDC